MKKSLLKTRIAKIIFLFISFVVTTFILGGFILNGLLRVPSQIANVIVIIAILLITRQAYKKEGKNLSELGLNPGLQNFGFGLFVSTPLLGQFLFGNFFIQCHVAPFHRAQIVQCFVGSSLVIFFHPFFC